MQRHQAAAWLAAGTGMWLGCTAPAPVSQDDARRTLMDADRAFAANTAAAGIDAWVEVFADSGFMLVPDLPITPGVEQVRRLMSPAFDDPEFSLSWEPEMASVAASGDLGFTIGRYVRTISAGDSVASETGRYITMWTREPGGAWKVLFDAGVPDRADSGV